MLVDIVGKAQRVVTAKALGPFSVALLERVDDGEMILNRALGAVVTTDRKAANAAHMHENVLRHPPEHAGTREFDNRLVKADIGNRIFREVIGRAMGFVERIENLDTELQELTEQKKEVFAEAKGEGFDVKILKEIIKLRKQDQEERDEREGLLDLYMRAMEQAGPEKVAKAA